MQTELDINKTDMAGSADVSSGAAHTNPEAVSPESEKPTQKPEPKKRGRKKGYHHSEATKAQMRRARTGVHPSKETKDKISKAKEGKNHSETAKLKMSDTRRYNFLRKELESAIAGTSGIGDLIFFFKKKTVGQGLMSDFAQKIYSMAQDVVNGFLKTPTDEASQRAAYTKVTEQIKELYDERIKELTQSEY